MRNYLSYIADKISGEIVSAKPVSGGDISSAYLLKTVKERYFLKVNNKPFALEMFHAEQKGLQTIADTRTIAVPHVHLVDAYEGTSFLLMAYIESKRPDGADYQRLGAELAQLHQCTRDDYGFAEDNFIGSLPQSNRAHPTWASFYWAERILPQLQRAVSAHLLSRKEIPSADKAITLFSNLCGDVKPSLLHGDLWGGNYLIAKEGTPYMIDPALYYGHAMVDIAMSRLFGGFGAEFYDAYHEIIPKPAHYAEQMELYQLYYLLVHLNLFGSGYHSAVSSILKRFF
jgi:fructosamine-3-kinase